MVAADLIVSRVRAHWRSRGWRIFLSDAGRWWATRHTRAGADGIDADTFTELTTKLERRR